MSLLTRCPSCNEALNPTESERIRGLCTCGGCGIEWPLDPSDNAKVDVELSPTGFDLESDRERFVLAWPVLRLGKLPTRSGPKSGHHGPVLQPVDAEEGVADLLYLLALVAVFGSIQKAPLLLVIAGWIAKGALALLLVLLVLLRPFRNRLVVQDGFVTRTVGPFTWCKVAKHDVAYVETRRARFRTRVYVVTRDQKAHELAPFSNAGNAEWLVGAIVKRLGLT